MDFKGKGPEHFKDSGKGAKDVSGAVLDVTQQKLREHRWRQHDQPLGPDIEKSDARLIEQYQFLLRSDHFRYLAHLATSNEQIILEDSSDVPDQPKDYNPYKHCIRVPLKTEDGIARPLADVRGELLWELRTACTRGALEHAKGLKPSDLGPASSPKEKERYPFEMAAFALSGQWILWRNTIEHVLCARAINADSGMGEGGPHVRELFKDKYAKVDRGWYNFVSYLKSQIKGENTSRYDPEAAKSYWVGKYIVAVAQKTNPASFRITQEQVRDWRRGSTTQVMSLSNNPFHSPAVIEQAIKDAQLARAAKAAKTSKADSESHTIL